MVVGRLFEETLASSVCPPGTLLKYQTPIGRIVEVGVVDEDGGTVSGMTFAELKVHLQNSDSRQLVNRLHAKIGGENLGLSALMARSLPRSATGVARALDGKPLPPFLIKLYHAWKQGYKDCRQIGRAQAFARAHPANRYSHFYPDNHIYDADHVIARHVGGCDSITNIQAISLSSHRTKTNLEMAKMRLARSRQHRRRQVVNRKSNRYWFRASRAIDYRGLE